MKIRVKFAKYGAVRFIGHLDVMRFFQKAIRRAGIDVAYSTGFSPHQIMSFAAPLGVGLCSNGEYMDVEINSHQGSADLLKRLQEACVPGIDVLSVKALPEGAGNAMASVAAASYAVCFKDESRNFTDLTGQLESYYRQPQIMITKETKKNTLEVDIRPGIYDLKVEDGCIYMLVDASSAGNIKPTAVLETFFKFAGLEIPMIDLQIIRLETYLNAGTIEKPEYAPLDSIGEDF